MHKTVLLFVCFSLVACLGVQLLADQTVPKPVNVTVKGRVMSDWDEEWNLKSVRIKDDSQKPPAVYNVVLDGKGKDLGDAMEGVTVEVVALLVEDKVKKTKTLTVKSYKEVEDLQPVMEEEDFQDEGEILEDVE